MKAVILDSLRFTDRRTAHEYISAELGFPAHYGHNLDALADCLSELPRDVCIVLLHRDGLTSEVGGYTECIAETISEILTSRCRFVRIQCK